MEPFQHHSDQILALLRPQIRVWQTRSFDLQSSVWEWHLLLEALLGLSAST
jgi:hypothetical protein